MEGAKEYRSAYPLRIPREVRERAEREAKANQRSLHAELLYRLREAYALKVAA